MTDIMKILKKKNQDYLIKCIKNDSNISVIKSCEIQNKIVMYVEFKDSIVRNVVRGKKNIIRFFKNKYLVNDRL
jgi:hypothetical protein